MPAATEREVVLARLAGPATYGPGKVAALRARVHGATIVAAFGDSPYDLSMLCEAELPVAVRPKSALRERAAECPALVELAAPAP